MRKRYNYPETYKMSICIELSFLSSLWIYKSDSENLKNCLEIVELITEYEKHFNEYDFSEVKHYLELFISCERRYIMEKIQDWTEENVSRETFELKIDICMVIMIRKNKEGGDIMIRRNVLFKVFEDNAGGLYMCTYEYRNGNECPIFFRDNYEFNHMELLVDIQAILQGDNPALWCNNMLDENTYFAQHDDILGVINDLEKNSMVVADNAGFYPRNMGSAARFEFFNSTSFECDVEFCSWNI